MAELPPEAAAADPAAFDFANSDIARTYDPNGAMGGLFVPGYIKGYAPSEQAVGAWNKENRSMTNQLVDELRMPNANPPPGGGGMANIPYGEPQPKDAAFLDPKGQIAAGRHCGASCTGTRHSRLVLPAAAVRRNNLRLQPRLVRCSTTSTATTRRCASSSRS